MPHSNPAIQKLLEDRYYLRDEQGQLLETEPEQMYRRVAKTVAKAELNYTDNPNIYHRYEEQFFELMNSGKFLPNTPLLINAGKEQPGCYSACFYIPVEDSMEGIFEAVKQAALISKAGGGVGFNFSSLRPKDSIVKSTGHKASGPISFMKVFNTMCDTVSQGGVRRGAMIALLSIDHPDVLEFISCKDDGVSFTNFNISVVITDDFMQAVRLGNDWSYVLPDGSTKTYSAVELFDKICEHAWKTGEPGLFFIDRARDDDFKINGVNPSLAKGTRVLTDSGIYPIEDLENKTVNVLTLDGKFASGNCILSGKDKVLYEVKLQGGQSYFATAEHKWPILTENGIEKRATNELKSGDYLPIGGCDSLNYGTIGSYDEGFMVGWNYGDGCITLRKEGTYQYHFTFSKENIDNGCYNRVRATIERICDSTLNPTIRNREGSEWIEINSSNKALHAFFSMLGFTDKSIGLPKSFWSELSEDFRKGFIDGLFSTDGSVDETRLCLHSIHPKLISDISEYLGFYGIKGCVKAAKSVNPTFPNGKTYDKEYAPQITLQYGKFAANRFSQLFSLSQTRKQGILDKLSIIKKHSLKEHYIKVEEVIKTDRIEDVWDLRVNDDTHTFKLSHCITGNCGELGLRDYESCIAKGELILTEKGFVPIEKITPGSYVASIKNGKTIYSLVSNVKNNGVKDIYLLTTKEGYKVKATEDHRFLTVDGWKEVQELNEDDELILGANYFLTEKEEEHLEWELLGWMHGDGWFTENSVGISFNFNDGDWEAKDRLLPVYKEAVLNGTEVKPLKNDGVSYQVQTERNSAYSFIEKYGVVLSRASERELPTTIWEATLEQQRAFLKGYITADGGVTGKANSQYKIASSNRKMLEQVQLLLTRFGIGSRISTSMMENYTNRKPQSQLVITGEDARLLVTTIGFLSTKKYEKFDLNPSYTAGKRVTVRVKSIEYVGTEEVYDLEVPHTRNFIVNGLVAHNCNLGSINLSKYVTDNAEFDFDMLKRDVPIAVRFLDDVIDVNHFPLPEIEKATKYTRKIGLGIMGWADTLLKLKIPYDSTEALNLAQAIMTEIKNSAIKTSIQLGKEKGIAQVFLDEGICLQLEQEGETSKIFINEEYANEEYAMYRRNYTLLCIAPTGTISRIAGCSSGIEPIFAWKIHHKLVDLEYDEVHWAYEALTTDTFPKYMITAQNVPGKWHLLHQATFQEFVDNSVSKTVNLPSTATIQDVKDIYFEAWNQNCKGITVYRDGCRENQPLNNLENIQQIDEIVTDEKSSANESLQSMYRVRGQAAVGVTYKLDTTKGKMYITVNYGQSQKEPVEVFIRLGVSATPREHELAEWCGRLLSMCLKYNVPIEKIVRQSSKVFSDISFIYNQRFFTSIPQLIGYLLELPFSEAANLAGLELNDSIIVWEPEFELSNKEDVENTLNNGAYCYNCGNYTMFVSGGCQVCVNCGYEKCG